MRLAQFPLFLLPLTGCGLASSQQRGHGEQQHPSTGVAPVELLTILTGLTSISRTMRLETLRENEHTAAEKSKEILGDIAIECYTLFTYAQRLQDTAPFDSTGDYSVLGIGFLKWQRQTGSFLEALGQSSEGFLQAGPRLTTTLVRDLVSFNKTAAFFCQKFEAVVPTLEPLTTRASASLAATFGDTIRNFTQAQPFGGCLGGLASPYNAA